MSSLSQVGTACHCRCQLRAWGKSALLWRVVSQLDSLWAFCSPTSGPMDDVAFPQYLPSTFRSGDRSSDHGDPALHKNWEAIAALDSLARHCSQPARLRALCRRPKVRCATSGGREPFERSGSGGRARLRHYVIAPPLHPDCGACIPAGAWLGLGNHAVAKVISQDRLHPIGEVAEEHGV